MDWDKLRVFHAVAEAGSFTHAGETLNLSQSAVSRQISGLEERLRVPLFHRHARGLILTEQGEILYRTTREIFSKLAMTEAMLAEGREKPKGPLKITTTVAFGSTWLTPNIKSFIDAYPEIAVTLLVDDNELDLSMREADVAIRMAPPRQPDLIQRHLMNIHFHLYASPEYLEQFGEPKSAAELGKHRLIIYGERSHLPFPDANWLLHLTRRESGVATLPALTVNNYYAIYRACLTGIGIAALPDYMVRDDTELKQVLPEIEGPQVPAYFVYPEELRNSKRITVLREFLLQNVANQQF